jgi:hypothetical protein
MQQRDGYRHTITVCQAVAKIRNFIESGKQNERDKRSGNAETRCCWECGRTHIVDADFPLT